MQADVARRIKEECEGELAVAMPILEDALAALDTIKEADIVYIRKLGNPPGAIKLVMEVSAPTFPAQSQTTDDFCSMACNHAANSLVRLRVTFCTFKDPHCCLCGTV